MKKIKLTQNKFTLVDNEDYVKFGKQKWHFNNGYAVRTEKIDGRREKIYLHRLILSTPRNKLSDHINRNRLDNRRSNLRIVDRTKSQVNRNLQSNNTSGHRGITFLKSRGKWRCFVKRYNKVVFLGYFSKKFKAIRARKEYLNGRS